MKKILIISPHFPPSNLVGVHRARFLSMHLAKFGWEPIILTVDEKYYEEKLDHNLEKLLPEGLRIERVRAMRITKPRLIGDIGLRAFGSLYRKAKKLIKDERIDFLYITIPSYYTTLIGRMLNKTTGIPYGIDYQDPWVHDFPGSLRFFSRPWLATRVAKILEPIAVKNTCLITGVTKGYYADVIGRNPYLRNQSLFADLPIGIEPSDFENVEKSGAKAFLFRHNPKKIKLVYAGTLLPKSRLPLKEVLEVIRANRIKFGDIEFHFIGSGSRPDDPEAYNVKPIAEEYGLWNEVVFEYPARIPYLDTLAHLKEANGIFILGSTEVHYSPSKVYQGILSGKPIFAILHSESSAIKVIEDARAGVVLSFDGEEDIEKIGSEFLPEFLKYLDLNRYFDKRNIKLQNLEPYFAESITRNLVEVLDKIIPDRPVIKKILLISPHFPPSNLTAVHRARLFSKYLPEFDWEPIVLTVDEKYYEEELDYNLSALIRPGTRIERTNARRVYKPRIIGDIGLRAFFSLYRRAKKLIEDEHIKFVLIIIPSFYGALWGRLLNKSTGVLYGIDYIDPWVHLFPGGKKVFSRAWFATKISRILEPFAVKRASLISGVAASYYEDVFKRNPGLNERCLAATLPPAAEESDFEKVEELGLKPNLFEKKEDKIQLVYAGAMQPSAYSLLDSVLRSISENKAQFSDVEFHFIGTGKSPDDENSFNIKPHAEKYGLWQKQIFEYPVRIPYLDVLVHLNAADGIFILGSTEPHYTPSKVYQAILSGRPILAILHSESTATTMIRETSAGIVFEFIDENDAKKLAVEFPQVFKNYMQFIHEYDFEKINRNFLSEHSSHHVTGDLVKSLNKIVE